ncbi:MAG TPA: potassium-transporting ATPase subunit KdpC [Phycisphaerales bacterium]|nr:potassium-transporting ATPase subunit KdpC [Phycisphaerales bacterium]
MFRLVRPAIVLFLALTLVTGVLYPAIVTGFALAAFPEQAQGSLIRDAQGRVVGSSLIGQEFGTSDASAAPALAKWFWGRPSATGPVPYTALNLDKGAGSSGSNLAPSNPALLDNIKARIAALSAADAAVGLVRAPDNATIPIDLVTSSASGLDPHISPRAAEYQAPRVAKARGLSTEQVMALVRKHTAQRSLGVLGEPVVNVLRLNLDVESATTSLDPPGNR